MMRREATNNCSHCKPTAACCKQIHLSMTVVFKKRELEGGAMPAAPPGEGRSFGRIGAADDAARDCNLYGV